MISVVLVTCALIQATATPEATLRPSTVALVETYADGRVNFELTNAKPAWMWTPVFPRLKDWQPPPGVRPVTALKFSRVLVGRDVRVEVTVLPGQSNQAERAVATVLVRPGAHVVISELRRFGLEPVDLSLADVDPLTPYLPSVFSVSPNLEIASVNVVNAPYPGYRVTVRNLSDRAVANFHVQSYRLDQKAVSLLSRDPEGRPFLTPGSSHTFSINLTSGRKTGDGRLAPIPLDVIEIDSVRWADGSVEGGPTPTSLPIASGAARRLQLTRIIAILRSAIDDGDVSIATLTTIRSAITMLPDQDERQLVDAERGMQSAKATALEDLTRFERDRSFVSDERAIKQWLSFTIDRYDRWATGLTQ